MQQEQLKKGLEDMTRTQTEMRSIIENFFRSGGYESQMSLLATAVQDIVLKGSGESRESLDNEFEYTNRFIRESVYDLTELQKFLIDLRESYQRYKNCANYLKTIDHTSVNFSVKSNSAQ